jgi:hypothetical protein
MSRAADRRPGSALLACLILGLGVAGCTDYLARRETISFHAGDAVATNKAVQIIDPWPLAAGRTDLETNGQHAAAAMERYNTGRVFAPQGSSTTTIAPPNGSASPSGAAVTN